MSRRDRPTPEHTQADDMRDDSSGPEEPAEFAGLREEIDAVGRKATRSVDLGMRAVVIASAVLVLLIGQLLPWMDQANGWEVLLGQAGATGKASMVPRLFALTSAGFGVLGSMIALVTRRWGMAWVCALGGWFAAVDGFLAVWSRQSSGTTPGIGLIIAEAAMIVIATLWLRTAWSRS
jgi:hypothetical protein